MDEAITVLPLSRHIVYGFQNQKKTLKKKK